ncbi:MAG: arginine N-succinyltransferase [Polyangiaceae bacterium]
MAVSFEIRSAAPEDEDQLLSVAEHLNTVNLPASREDIRGILDLSEKSFSARIKDPRRREYVFVLIDRERSSIVGTSMIIGQLGRRDAPYVYVDVSEEERYSATLDRHFRHVVLKVGYSYSGPTEIGGLIVLPEYRKRSEKLGLLISHVRFLYMKMHRECFRDEVLAELLPPLEPDGTSHLWDALGRKFTEMTYADADRLSKKNKEFVRGLFPDGPIYASLLPDDAQGVIGKVGAQTKGVEKMLRRAGFRYAHRVDPFDGGPHFTAPTDDVLPLQRAHEGRVTGLLSPEQEGSTKTRALIAVEAQAHPFFRSAVAPWRCGEAGELATAEIGAEVASHLGLSSGDHVWVLPLDRASGGS